MTGSWLVTTPNINDGMSTTATTQQTVNRDLPRSNFLNRVTCKLHIVGVGTPTLTLDRFRVYVSGSIALCDVRGGQLRGLNKFMYGSAGQEAIVSTTDAVWVFTWTFGRGYRDELEILPGKAFKQVQAQFQYTPGAGTSVTSVALTMSADEFVSDDDPKSKLLRRVIEEADVASAASAVQRSDVTPGPVFRAWYVDFAHPANVSANSPATPTGGTVAATLPIKVLVNGGADTPHQEPADLTRIKNIETYRFDDAQVPRGELGDAFNPTRASGNRYMICIDFDPRDDLGGTDGQELLDSSKMNRLQSEWTVAGSDSTGNTRLITDGIIVV